MSLPFCQTTIDAFAKRVRAAALAGGKKESVTIEELRKTFITPAWRDLKDDNSNLVKILKSDAFVADDDLISVDALICWGVLNCPDDTD